MSIGADAFALITYGLAVILTLLYLHLLRITLRRDPEDAA